MASKYETTRRSKAAILKDLNEQLAVRGKTVRKQQHQAQHLLNGALDSAGQKEHASRIPRPVQQPVSRSKEDDRKKRKQSSTSPRSTFLLKKYGTLWLRATFGRVSPSRARCHRRRNVLSTALKRWEDAWWESRREWRLMVRAECHDRYRVWRQVWLSWRSYVRLQHSKQAKYAVALQHADHQLLLRCWSGWREFMAQQKTHRQTYAACKRHADRFRLRRVFQQWAAEYRHAMLRKKADQAGLQFHQHFLLKQSWKHWKVGHTVLAMCRQKSLVSKSHHCTTLAGSVMAAWRSYVAQRRQKHELKMFAISWWRRQRLTGLMHRWHELWSKRCRIAEHEELIIVMGERATKRRLFILWQLAVAHRRQKQLASTGAVQHHLHYTKISVLRAWKTYTTKQVSQQKSLDVARQFLEQQTLRRFWLLWLCRCESEEEARLVTATHYARTHRSKVMLRKCLAQFCRYAQWRRHRKARYAFADGHFARKTLPKYFHQLQMYSHVQQQEASRLRQAVAFRRENMMACFFYLWVSRADQVTDSRQLHHQAVHHYSSMLCQGVFTMWLGQYQKARQGLILANRAVEADERRLYSWVLDSWTAALARRRKLHGCDARAVALARRKTLLQPYLAWRKFVAVKRQSSHRHLYAFQYWARRKLRLAFIVWKDSHSVCHADNQMACAHRQVVSTALLRRVVQMWHFWASHKRNCRRMFAIADNFEQSHLLAKTFRCWVEASGNAAEEERALQQQAVDCGRILEQASLLRAFRSWHAVVADVRLRRWKWQLAVDMDTLRVARKALVCWKVFHRQSLGKKLLYEQAVLTYATSLQRRALATWHAQLLDSMQEKRQTLQALFFWSCCLRLKTFHAWRGYVLYRRQRRKQYDTALLQHQHYVLHAGLSQWLKAGSDLAHHRRSQLTEQHMQMAVSTLHCVRRCAAHWRQWARQRSVLRQPSQGLRTVSAAAAAAAVGGAIPTRVSPAVPGQPWRVVTAGHPRPLSLPAVREHGQTGRLTQATSVSLGTSTPFSKSKDCVPAIMPSLPAASGRGISSTTSGLSAVEMFQRLVAERSNKVRTVPRLPAAAGGGAVGPVPGSSTAAAADVPSESQGQAAVRAHVPDSLGTAAAAAAAATERRRVSPSESAGLAGTPSFVLQPAVFPLPAAAAPVQSPDSQALLSLAVHGAGTLPVTLSSKVTSQAAYHTVGAGQGHDGRSVQPSPSKTSPVLLPPSAFSIPPADCEGQPNGDSRDPGSDAPTESDLKLMQSAMKQHLDRLLRLKELQHEIAESENLGGDSQHLTMLMASAAALQERITRDTPRVRQIASLMSSLLPSAQ